MLTNICNQPTVIANSTCKVTAILCCITRVLRFGARQRHIRRALSSHTKAMAIWFCTLKTMAFFGRFTHMARHRCALNCKKIVILSCTMRRTIQSGLQTPFADICRPHGSLGAIGNNALILRRGPRFVSATSDPSARKRRWTRAQGPSKKCRWEAWRMTSIA